MEKVFSLQLSEAFKCVLEPIQDLIRKFYMQSNANALSFYRFQNVLCRSKFFVPDQNFIYILWQSQTFCARQKEDLHSVKLVFVPAQKVLEMNKMQSTFWAGSKNLDRHKTFWDL